ncbi:MAG: iron chelate uptake ABC transporter family permease subunit [Pseudomonadota bacterium]|nr:iron chelate uptake ABC transporter family permease subunit [Pseudomonadota bacterium]
MNTVEVLEVITLQAGYNTAVVLVGVIALGVGGGVIGVFSLLRKRALISDAISHATLPGIAIAFMLSVALGGSGRNLALLMAGAALTGAMGIFAVQWICRHTRLAEDTAIGTVLSVFFGIGIVLLSHIQTMQAAGQAGLNHFLLGSTALLTSDEALLISISSAVAIVCSIAFMKEFGSVAFDEGFAKAQGWRVARIDLIMMLLILAIVTIGLKTVGLILIIALVIIPPAAARFWTNRLGRMVALSGAFGGLAGWAGGSISALLPDMPAGAMIVLAATSIFIVSLLCAPRTGVVAWSVRQLGLQLTLAETRGLLAMASGNTPPDPMARRMVRWRGYIDSNGQLTASGTLAATEADRQRQLWEAYRKRNPEADTSFYPLGGCRIEEVLSPDVVSELESRNR